MEYYYNCYTKVVQDQKLYFVKKYMRFSEFKGVSDYLEGYAMHADFKKACKIAGVTDAKITEQLWSSVAEQQQPAKVIGINASIGKIATN